MSGFNAKPTRTTQQAHEAASAARAKQAADQRNNLPDYHAEAKQFREQAEKFRRAADAVKSDMAAGMFPEEQLPQKRLEIGQLRQRAEGAENSARQSERMARQAKN